MTLTRPSEESSSINMELWVFSVCQFIMSGALMSSGIQGVQGQSPSTYFLPEFALSPQGSFLEDTTGEEYLTYRYDDQSSRTTRSDVERDSGWDAWGGWSDCSRTCGGGASYSLRRCLNGGNCEGRNIRYRTCSNTDCPPESGDFRAQQCSAHNDIKYQGQTYEWIPASHDHASLCTLRCQARGRSLVVELAPKVLDGTRCRADSLDMCINGICEEVGCDRQLGSTAKEDVCGVCAGDGSTCRLVRGQALPHLSPEEPMKTVIEVPLGSRGLRLTAKGPDIIVIEAHTASGKKEEMVFSSAGSYVLANSIVDFQRGTERQALRSHGPLSADFTIKLKYAAPKDTTVQFLFHQPIRYQWRETDFFPCSVTCGGGYQLNSADCMDIRYNKSVPDHHCYGYPENTKPKPKLKECNMDPCLESDGFKEVMPYDHFQPLPRWEQNPWTSCSVSCGGGSQERSVTCVEEDIQGQLVQVEEWKCSHSPRPSTKQSCNLFHCPKWVAMEWSQCTVTCGRGLRYRVVLCIDHRGQHTGGCSSSLKPHIKEDCLVPVACHKPRESVPVEAKLPWLKQAQELEETKVAREEPTLVPGPWSACSVSCGVGLQKRSVRCKVLLSFTQAEVDLPDDECSEQKPPLQRACSLGPCTGAPTSPQWPPDTQAIPPQQGYLWQYSSFAACSASCAVGSQSALVRCVKAEVQEVVDDAFCDDSVRPPAMVRICNPQPCPARWEVSEWNQCSVSCGVGLQTRSVSCVRPVGENHTELVGGAKCQGPKPSELQACNQVECPPYWETEEWQQCSRSCGGGTQWRKVYCRQRLGGGSYRRLPDGRCDGVKPASNRPCAHTHCLQPHLEGGEWSKCSVTCGKGVQRREPVCRRLTASGQLVTLDISACSGLPSPPLIRSCRMSPCSKHKFSKKQCPQVLGLKRIYIQTRQEKRLSFTIGGRAYLLPKTSVIIKCPVRHFPKAQIHWDKDGIDLQSSKRLSVTRSGALRIYSLEAGDIGQYRCWANQDSDIFILKLIGHDNRLLEHPEGKRLGKEKSNSSSKTFFNKEGGYTKCQGQEEMPFVKKIQKPGRSWMQKNELYLDESWTKAPVDPLSMENYHLASSSASDVLLSGASGAFTLEVAQFEELVRNISQLAESGDVTDDLASRLIGRLMEEMAVARPTTGDGEATQEGSEGKHPDRTPNSSERSGGRGLKSRPVIARHGHRPSTMSFQRDLRVEVGRTVHVTNATRSLTLLCSVQGIPPPTLTWTKDGLPLPNRVLWDSSGGLHITNPGTRDAGIYRCTASNEMGSDSETTQVLLAYSPSITASSKNMSDLHSASLKVVVGGRVVIRTGANLTLQCPATGVPEPSVRWHRLEGALSGRASPLPDGSLLLRDLSPHDYGTYTCVAANPIGKTAASSTLHVAGPTAASSEEQASVLKEMNRKRVLMASRMGTSIAVRPGDVLRIAFEWRFTGWSVCSASCGNRGSQTRQVRCVSTDGLDTPPSSCQHLPKPGPLPRPCNLHDCPASWASTVWSKCSTVCGTGFRQRQVSCQRLEASGSMRVLPASACEGIQRPADREPCTSDICAEWVTSPWGQCSGRCLGPAIATQSRTVSCRHVNGSNSKGPCNPKERPASVRNCTSEMCDVLWRALPWRPCTVACGSGFQSRKVECAHRHNNKTLPDRQCTWQRRPLTWQHCNVTSCSGECKDTTHYCTVVKRLRLCLVEPYRQRCCQSCTEDSAAI
ncbi:ADAMTS-like protein 3 isoform X2 [Brachyhypopomus gauderio]|uniref:ADAMTS-like protein 3 isoform X2 n=1 Tax=Brachyhypopomus gauderio TaxID=698409 RepID=UPI004042E8CE